MGIKIKLFRLLAVFVTIWLAFSPVVVYGALENLTVDAAGHYVNGTYVGGAGTWANLNSDDANTSYVSVAGTVASPLKQTYSFSNSAVTGINSVTLYFKVQYQSAGGTGITAYARQGTQDYFKATYVITDTTYTMYSVTWDTNPAGGDWTLATINTCEFGLEFQGTYRWTYAYLTVNYTPASYPTVVTNQPTLIGLTNATMNGEITNIGASAVTSRGFVWDTVSVPVNPGNVLPAASGYGTNFSETSSWGISTFQYSAAVLVVDTAYYYRAFSTNGAGYSYGDEIAFRTISNPDITLKPANNIARTTATIGAVVGYDGSRPCDIRFGWDTVTQAANADLYANHSDWILNTYVTGDIVAHELSGLVSGTPYFYNVQIRNDHVTVQGTEATFTTSAVALSAPTNLAAKPEALALNLSWSKTTEGTGTWVVYKYTTYPTTTADGVTAYKGTSTSYRLTGLESGRTVYVSAWTYSGATTSATKADCMVTTLAYDTTDVSLTLPKPAWNFLSWLVEPNSANLQKLPGRKLVAGVATAYQMPETTLWFFLGIVLAVALAAFVWGFDSNHSTQAALIALNFGLFGGVAAGIYAGWMLFVCIFWGIASFIIASRS